MDGPQKPILVMSGARGGGGGGSRGSARGFRGAARGRATFRNRSATFVNDAADSSVAGDDGGEAGAGDGAQANAAQGMNLQGSAGLHAPAAGSSFRAPFQVFGAFGAGPSGPPAFGGKTPSQAPGAQHGAGALNAAAPIFTPAAPRTVQPAVDRTRYPTPPLEENRFLEMKNERDELRKKYIREGILPDPLKPQQLSEAVKLKGTCMRMCPEFECHEREFQKELDRWELRLDSPQTGGGAKVDQRLAVKIYRRPAAGREIPLPEEIRPPDILKRTMDYLVNVLLPDTITSPTFALVQPFLWDRTRAIRQDFIVQADTGALAIECHERIARLHILCLHARGGPGAEKWSEQQELEQLRKTLRSLIEFYEDRRQAAASDPEVASVAPNEAEFRAYNLLLHLRDPETLREVELLPTSIFMSEQVQFALRLRTYAQRSNNLERRGQPINEEATLNFFTAFFKEVDRLPAGVGYLLACLAENVFTDLRRGAVKTMCRAYHERLASPTFDFLRRCLALGPEYTDDEAVSVLATMGIEVSDDGTGKVRANTKRGVAVLEDKPLPFASEYSRVIEAKRAGFTNAEVVDGIAAGAAPLIEVSVPPFISWNPHLEKEVSAARPARTRSVSIVAPPNTRLPIKAENAGPLLITPAQQVATPAPVLQPAFRRPSMPVETAFSAPPPTAFSSTAQSTRAPTVSAFGSPFTIPTSNAFLQHPPQATSTQPLQEPKKPSVAFMPRLSSETAAFGIAQSAPTALPKQSPIRTTPEFPLPGPSAQTVASTPNTGPPFKAVLQTPLASPASRRSSTEKPSTSSPALAKSPIRLRPPSISLPHAEAAAIVPIPAGPTAEELAALAKAAREASRSKYLDRLQQLLTDQVLADVLTGHSTNKAASLNLPEDLPIVDALAQETLAVEFHCRITQTSAFDRWQTRFTRARRDKANIRRLRDLLHIASDRSLLSTSFFMGSKAALGTRPNSNSNTQRSLILASGKDRSSHLASIEPIADFSMQDADAITLVESKRRKEELWASGDFFRAICRRLQVASGAVLTGKQRREEWLAIASLASDDPATATSEWLRQKLRISSSHPVGSASVRRADGHRLIVTLSDLGAVPYGKSSSIGLVLFELSQHVLQLDEGETRTTIDPRDLRRLKDTLLSLSIGGWYFVPGLIVVNWEIKASAEELARQIQESIFAEPKLVASHAMLSRVRVLMAGELDGIEAVQSAFEKTLQGAIPSVDAHPVQKVLALRRSLTLQDMASQLFEGLLNILVPLSDLFQSRPSGVIDGLPPLGRAEECTDAVTDAFNTVTALCNYGIKALFILSEHIMDEDELSKELSLPMPSIGSVALTRSAAAPDAAFQLGRSQLSEPRLRSQERIALIQCLLDQQAAEHQDFPWRVYFSELLGTVLERAGDTFISCRVELDVEAEMAKVANQLDKWGHQLLSEIHNMLSSYRAAGLKRSRSAAGDDLAESSKAKKARTPTNSTDMRKDNHLTSGGGSNSLSAMLARARQLVDDTVE